MFKYCGRQIFLKKGVTKCLHTKNMLKPTFFYSTIIKMASIQVLPYYSLVFQGILTVLWG